jgi:hypothetical protein
MFEARGGLAKLGLELVGWQLSLSRHTRQDEFVLLLG